MKTYIYTLSHPQTGEIRYVVEYTLEGVQGMLHIFNESQLEYVK